jgi:hypothetical protein
MTVPCEDVLENRLISTFKSMNYEYVQRDEEVNLKTNIKKQQEMHSRKRVAGLGRIWLAATEVEKVITHLKGGRILGNGQQAVAQ